VPASSALAASAQAPWRTVIRNALSGGHRELRRIAIAEEWTHDGPVVVLDGAAPRFGLDQLEAPQLDEDTRVIRDVAKRLVEFLRQVGGTGDPLVERHQNAHAQWMAECSHQAQVDLLSLSRYLVRHRSSALAVSSATAPKDKIGPRSSHSRAPSSVTLMELRRARLAEPIQQWKEVTHMLRIEKLDERISPVVAITKGS
jgi:hypothetical protein